MGVGAVVVEHEVQLPPRIGFGDLFAEGQELDVWRWRSKQRSVTLPVATSKAANSVVVPWRT
jgi:hypothetical protein